MGEHSPNHPTSWFRRHQDELDRNVAGKLPLLLDVEPVVHSYDVERLLPLNMSDTFLSDYRRLLTESGNVSDMSIAQTRHNVETATRHWAGIVAVAREGNRVVGTLTGTLYQQNEAWLEEYIVDDTVDETTMTPLLFDEVHEWFNRMGVRQVNFAVEGERTLGLYNKLGYHCKYDHIVFEKPLLHTVDMNARGPSDMQPTKNVSIHGAAGVATVQYLPSGTKSWIIPPAVSTSANDVMRRLETWLSTKDVEAARYTDYPEAMPYPGYAPTTTQIYRRYIE